MRDTTPLKVLAINPNNETETITLHTDIEHAVGEQVTEDEADTLTL